MVSLATFNANNFFLRYSFAQTYPGDRSRASLIEAGEVGLLGYLPGLAFGQYTSSFVVWDAARRKLAADALKEPDDAFPDILCFQEVENTHAIRVLNQRYMNYHYPYSLLIDSYDPRNIDVGLLSAFPIVGMRSHIDEVDEEGERVFSRDCLEADIELPGGDTLTLFISHLKSKFVSRDSNDTDADYHEKILRSHEKRLAQAARTAQYVDQRFAGHHGQALYAVVGDFNDTPLSPWVDPLVNSPHLTDVVTAHREADDCWTYYWRSKNRVSHIDYVLASEALAARVCDVVAADPLRQPFIQRKGLAYRERNNVGEILPKQATLVHFEEDPVTVPPDDPVVNPKVDFRFERYDEVMQDWGANISDHCPVKVWF